MVKSDIPVLEPIPILSAPQDAGRNLILAPKRAFFGAKLKPRQFFSYRIFSTIFASKPGGPVEEYFANRTVPNTTVYNII